MHMYTTQTAAPLDHPISSSSSSSSTIRTRSTTTTTTSSGTPHQYGDGCGELQRVFTYFDKDGDGKISAAELQSCFMTVGIELLSDDDAHKAVRTSDADGDGMLGFHDFAKLMQTPKDDNQELSLREAFHIYSSGHTYITPISLNKMLTRLGLGHSTTITNCKAMIRHFDLNGDGLLNFDEFLIMMS